jgi:hypothetical protein
VIYFQRHELAGLGAKYALRDWLREISRRSFSWGGQDEVGRKVEEVDEVRASGFMSVAVLDNEQRSGYGSKYG